jgi:hypothetical protein
MAQFQLTPNYPALFEFAFEQLRNHMEAETSLMARLISISIGACLMEDQTLNVAAYKQVREAFATNASWNEALRVTSLVLECCYTATGEFDVAKLKRLHEYLIDD